MEAKIQYTDTIDHIFVIVVGGTDIAASPWSDFDVGGLKYGYPKRKSHRNRNPQLHRWNSHYSY